VSLPIELGSSALVARPLDARDKTMFCNRPGDKEAACPLGSTREHRRDSGAASGSRRVARPMLALQGPSGGNGGRRLDCPFKPKLCPIHPTMSLEAS
jgi:hypothetical protein